MALENTERKYWALPAEELFKELDSSESGLSVDEAAERLLSGRNKIATSRRTGRLKIFGRQLLSPLLLMLIIAATITAFLGDYKNTLFIFLAVAINATLGFYQENKAESALANLH